MQNNSQLTYIIHIQLFTNLDQSSKDFQISFVENFLSLNMDYQLHFDGGFYLTTTDISRIKIINDLIALKNFFDSRYKKKLDIKFFGIHEYYDKLNFILLTIRNIQHCSNSVIFLSKLKKNTSD